MTVSQELREWATVDGKLLYHSLTDKAFTTLEDWEGIDSWDAYSENDRRTLALLVACALEDE